MNFSSKAAVGKITRHCSASVAATLASSSVGRMLLHAMCLIHHPARLRWHWNGILREISG
jgi:hypothetical protein